MIVRLLAALALLVAAPALAADPSGTWGAVAGDATLFRVEVTRTPGGWTGAWVRPAHYESDGDSFTSVEGPPVRRLAIKGEEKNGVVLLTFDDPAPGATPDIFRLRRLDPDHVEMTYVGARMEPFVLVRQTAATPIGPWDKARTYTRIIDRPTNAEMTAIFDADQAARADGVNIDWSKVEPADRARQVRTQALLDAGALASGDDFYHAAFIFQHGDKSEDYLKAHILATIATARGRTGATWIAAATLDRYLMNIDRPQIFGTQYMSVKDGTTTQAPYDSALLSDAMRQAMRVPVRAEQEERRKAIEAEAKAAAAKR